jgi:cystathionine beta-lyase
MKTINLPIYKGSTVLLSYDDMVSIRDGKYEGIIYGTHGNPNQIEFENEMKKLEGGYKTWSFPSGFSAITNSILAIAKSDDNILVCDNVYNPVRNFCDEILTRLGITTTYIPSDIGVEILKYINPKTCLIYLESPCSNTFEIQDISSITTIAKYKNIPTIIDNTWATPLYLNPFSFDVDISIHSISKYISNNDVIMGTVTSNEKYANVIDKYYKTMQIHTAPEDCNMALNGLKTLKLRLKQHELSTLQIAKWLSEHEKIETVLYPALPNHQNYDRWCSMFTGASGLFSIRLRNEYSDEVMKEAVDKLKTFGVGFGWGSWKSLLVIGIYLKKKNIFDRKMIRINIGLESIDNIKNDLKIFLNHLV